MIIVACAHNNVERIHADVGAASHTRRNDEVGLVAVNHFHSSDGCIHLSDAALLHNKLVGKWLSVVVFALSVQVANYEVFSVFSLGMTVVEQCAQLREFLVHRNDDANFHFLSLSFSLVFRCKVTKKNWDEQTLSLHVFPIHIFFDCSQVHQRVGPLILDCQDNSEF